MPEGLLWLLCGGSFGCMFGFLMGAVVAAARDDRGDTPGGAA
ncbi:MAG: hypothetical protein ACK57Q_15355 [Planctomycetota bacterium]